VTWTRSKVRRTRRWISSTRALTRSIVCSDC
jgi:hypothetical protein